MRGTVEKYGNSWRIRYDAGLKPDGKRDQRSKAGFKTKREAQEALSETLERVRRGESLDARKITVGEFLDSWLESKRNLRPSTHRAYDGHIRVYLKPLIGNVPLASLRADHLDQMYTAIRSGRVRKAPGLLTIRHIHATLRTALQSAYKRRLISYNPAGQVELEAGPLQERGVWTATQLATFLAHADQHRLGPAYRVLAFTGLRRGELCGLRWSDLDLEAVTATIRQQLVQSGKDLIFGEPKSKRGARTIALDPDTVTYLRSHRASQAAERLAWGAAYNALDLVFCREDGSPLRPDRLSNLFVTLSEQAGLPRIVLHGLRHTHATLGLAAGVDITVMSRRLGHSTSSFTADTYTRVPEEVARDAAGAIASLVRAAGATSTTRPS
jgi:integrase